MIEKGEGAGISAEVLAPVAMPIAGAPRNGTVFIALDYLGYPQIVWGDERGFFSVFDGEKLDEIDWWSPVPAVPKS